MRKADEFPSGFVIETTRLCNSNCVTCPHGKDTDRPAIMDWEAFCSLVGQCVGEAVSYMSLALYGEPLMDPLLVDRVREIRTSLDGNVEAQVFTNGTLMTENMARKLLEAGVGYMTFSLDGVSAESFNLVRPTLDYQLIVDNVHRFLTVNDEMGHPCTTRIHMTAIPETLSEVEDFRLGWLAVPGMDIASWLPCDGRGGEDRATAIEDNSTEEPCIAPFKCIHVKTNGDLALCCQDWNAEVLNLNVFDTSIRDVWGSEGIRDVRELHNAGRKREIPLCAQCRTRY